MARDGLLHQGLLYRSDAAYATELAGFARDALRRGEPVFFAVPPGRDVGLRAALAADAGRVTFADMSRLGRNPSAIIPAIHDFLGRYPGRRASCVAEPAWVGRSGPELLEVVRHEALVNLAFAGAPLNLVCPYDQALPATVLTGAQCTHPLLAGDSARSHAYLGPGRMPPGCDGPLPAVPPGAVRLAYSSDLRPVRKLVADRAAAAGLPKGRAVDLVLAVSEVAANTLRHTCATGALSIWRAGDELMCQIEDSGHITSPLAGRRRQPALSSGRQGLWLVNQVCDLVELRTGRAGTTVRMHMRLGGAETTYPDLFPAALRAALPPQSWAQA